MAKESMGFIAIASHLETEDKCLAFLERMRWPMGVQCILCESGRTAKFQVKETSRKVKRSSGAVETVAVPARRLYQCLECGHQFAATTGTLFHDTHLPLPKWFFAIALMINAKQGLSARQMQRHLNVTYKTAWYLCHRIRESIDKPTDFTPSSWLLKKRLSQRSLPA
jgi:transposase-like protein